MALRRFVFPFAALALTAACSSPSDADTSPAQESESALAGDDSAQASAEGRACGPDAEIPACPVGCYCQWHPGDIDVGHCARSGR